MSTVEKAGLIQLILCGIALGALGGVTGVLARMLRRRR